MIQPDLFPPYVKGSDTSLAAAESVKNDTNRWRNAVLNIITRAQGATCDEVEVILGRRHQNISARCTELRDMGKTFDSGERRRTRSGRKAIVWKVK